MSYFYKFIYFFTGVRSPKDSNEYPMYFIVAGLFLIVWGLWIALYGLWGLILFLLIARFFSYFTRKVV